MGATSLLQMWTRRFKLHCPWVVVVCACTCGRQFLQEKTALSFASSPPASLLCVLTSFIRRGCGFVVVFRLFSVSVCLAFCGSTSSEMCTLSRAKEYPFAFRKCAQEGKLGRGRYKTTTKDLVMCTNTFYILVCNVYCTVFENLLPLHIVCTILSWRPFINGLKLARFCFVSLVWQQDTLCCTLFLPWDSDVWRGQAV